MLGAESESALHRPGDQRGATSLTVNRVPFTEASAFAISAILAIGRGDPGRTDAFSLPGRELSIKLLLGVVPDPGFEPRRPRSKRGMLSITSIGQGLDRVSNL